MKKNIFIALVFIVAFATFFGCDDAADNVGVQVQPAADRLTVGADTFHLSTQTIPIANIISRPDSFLLGTYVDNFIGSTHGDILTEFILPTTDFTYLSPDVATTTPDSVLLTLYFNTYFGSKESPLNISVYELSDSLHSNKDYTTDLNPADFVNFSKKIGSKVISAVNSETNKVDKRIDIKLSADFLNRFFTSDATVFQSQDSFKKFFHGLYITADFGSSTMLLINSLKLRLHYHYFYNNEPNSVINSYHDFWANEEVKRVNRLVHPYRSSATSNTNFNLIASPANYYTRIRIPLERMRKRIKMSDSELNINSASLRLDIQDKSNYNDTQLPYVRNLLLIKEARMDDFFAKHMLPSDTLAFMTALDSTKITSTTYKYHYKFSSLSTIIENEVKNDSTGMPFLDMVLIPVTPKYVSSSSSYSSTSYRLSSIDQNMNMQAIKINSGSNSEIPMKMEVVYSGF